MFIVKTAACPNICNDATHAPLPPLPHAHPVVFKVLNSCPLVAEKWASIKQKKNTMIDESDEESSSSPASSWLSLLKHCRQRGNEKTKGFKNSSGWTLQSGSFIYRSVAWRGCCLKKRQNIPVLFEMQVADRDKKSPNRGEVDKGFKKKIKKTWKWILQQTGAGGRKPGLHSDLR